MSATAIVGFVVLFGAGVWLLYSERNYIRLGVLSYRWIKTVGTIVDSRDDSFTIDGIGGSSGVSAPLPVEYKQTVHVCVYEVGGHTYRCTTYCFGGWADSMAAAYSVGEKVPVYYNPKRPDVAVLRRGVQLGSIFGVVLVAAAFLWLYLSLRK